MSYADEILAKIRADLNKPITPRPVQIKQRNTFNDLPGELWAEIKTYPGYFVSNMGRVASEKQGYRKLLAIANIKKDSGQLNARVCLVDKQKHSVSVANLVADTFIPKPDNKQTRLIHLDGDRTNNKTSNLKWATPIEQSSFYKGESYRQHSLKLGGNKSLVSNRITKDGWCVACACTIPVQKQTKNRLRCTHV